MRHSSSVIEFIRTDICELQSQGIKMSPIQKLAVAVISQAAWDYLNRPRKRDVKKKPLMISVDEVTAFLTGRTEIAKFWYEAAGIKRYLTQLELDRAYQLYIERKQRGGKNRGPRRSEQISKAFAENS